MDLTKDEKCYTYYLKQEQTKLRLAAFDNKLDLDSYKDLVGNTIKSAQQTPKKREFLKNMNAKDNKPEIYYYIKNSINRAENYTC